jgi:hypothetical protein
MNNECKRCGGALIGSEQRGDICNECLDLGSGAHDEDDEPAYPRPSLSDMEFRRHFYDPKLGQSPLSEKFERKAR